MTGRKVRVWERRKTQAQRKKGAAGRAFQSHPGTMRRGCVASNLRDQPVGVKIGQFQPHLLRRLQRGFTPGLNPSGDRERPVFRGNDGRNTTLYPMIPPTKSRAETVRHNPAAENGARGGTTQRRR